jgi:transposase-like protein
MKKFQVTCLKCGSENVRLKIFTCSTHEKNNVMSDHSIEFLCRDCNNREDD